MKALHSRCTLNMTAIPVPSSKNNPFFPAARRNLVFTCGIDSTIDQ